MINSRFEGDGLNLGIRFARSSVLGQVALSDLLAACMGKRTGTVSSFPLGCLQATGALGMGVASLSSECKLLLSKNCAIVSSVSMGLPNTFFLDKLRHAGLL